MKAMLCKAFGPPESLVLDDAPEPAMGEDEVRVEVHAAGVNFPDLLMIEGKYQYKPPFPFAPGAEASGVVLETGAKVTGIRPGDRVIAMTGSGAFAEQVVVRQHKIRPMPAAMDFVTAASLGLTYGTTAHALIQRGQLQPGEWLLVHGASGGVGMAAVEIGKAMGAKVIGTGGSDEKLRVATEHGCDHVINYSEPFRDKVKELTGGNGADVIYDAVGGDVFDQLLRCINWNGRLLVIGFASGRIPQAPANLALLKSCSIVGVFWGAWTEREPETDKANFRQIFRWWEEGKLRPHVSHTFRLEHVPEALVAIRERRVVGKAVVVVRD